MVGENSKTRVPKSLPYIIEKFEKDRIADKPIRLILLKARQWGGSTATQMYFAWLQFIHKVGLNSLIIAHQGSTSDEGRALGF